MKELIKITTTENGKQLVSARELYEGLGLNKAAWARWSKKNILENEYFTENVDWEGFNIMLNGNETTDYAISLDFAKHLAMMAKTEKSHEYRSYFIECEKGLKEITSSLDALKGLALLKVAEGKSVVERIGGATEYANLVSKPLIDKIEEDKPKVTYYDDVLNTKGSMTTTQIAKGFGMTSHKLNTYLSDKGIQFKKSGMWNLYKEYDGKGYTEVRTYVNKKKETTCHYLVWTEKGKEFIYNLLLEDKMIK